MSAITQIAFGENAPATERTRRFRPSTGRGDPGVADRQARATLLAFRTCSDRAAAVSFLHTFDAELNGRPLDVAGTSVQGFDRVIAAIRAVGRAAPVG